MEISLESLYSKKVNNENNQEENNSIEGNNVLLEAIEQQVINNWEEKEQINCAKNDSTNKFIIFKQKDLEGLNLNHADGNSYQIIMTDVEDINADNYQTCTLSGNSKYTKTDEDSEDTKSCNENSEDTEYFENEQLKFKENDFDGSSEELKFENKIRKFLKHSDNVLLNKIYSESDVQISQQKRLDVQISGQKQSDAQTLSEVELDKIMYPYICAICSKGYSTRGGRNKHERNNHGSVKSVGKYDTTLTNREIPLNKANLDALIVIKNAEDLPTFTAQNISSFNINTCNKNLVSPINSTTVARDNMLVSHSDILENNCTSSSKVNISESSLVQNNSALRSSTVANHSNILFPSATDEYSKLLERASSKTMELNRGMQSSNLPKESINEIIQNLDKLISIVNKHKHKELTSLKLPEKRYATGLLGNENRTKLKKIVHPYGKNSS